MYLNKTTIDEPNFSIVLPGPCNANCKFCFWKKEKTHKNYIERLKTVLDCLPSQFKQISLTGGEPTLSQYLREVVECIDKKKFPKVVLTTNGSGLLDSIQAISGKVDHVNISRHSILDEQNFTIFGTDKLIPTTSALNHLCYELNKQGIDVTLSAVLNKYIKKADDAILFIKYAKFMGASQIFFRKEHGSIEPSSLEMNFRKFYKYTESSCPACRSVRQIIQGIPVIWKTAISEPSTALDEIYEVIYHPSGKLTEDWKKEKLVTFRFKEQTTSVNKSDASDRHNGNSRTSIRNSCYGTPSNGCYVDSYRFGCGRGSNC